MSELYEPNGPRDVLHAMLAVADAEGMSDETAIPVWPNRTEEDRQRFSEYPQLTVAKVRAIAAALNAEERVKELEGALDTAISAIASLEPEALGVAEDYQTGAPAYPIRDALLHNLRQARRLAQERPDAGTAD